MSFYDNATQATDFEAIRLKLASPEQIRTWSHGEVLRPETINYRTQKPEKDGLFCEKIFGPSKDWECYCGKYKRIRYKGIVCDKCGVEVTRSIVRRERMAHIDLAAPVTHIWFLRGVPSKIGLLLDLSTQSLEKVVYFANYIITEVNEKLREQTLEQIDAELDQKRKQIRNEITQQMGDIKQRRDHAEQEAAGKLKKDAEKAFEQEMVNAAVMRDEKLKDLDEASDIARKELKGLAPLNIVSESEYFDLSLKYGHVFTAMIGAEAMKSLLSKINLEEMAEYLEVELSGASKNKRFRLLRRLKLVKNLIKNGISPDWMVLDALPVIPPDLRPMVQLDGGRFAASDLNDLYRRVINRNNRLKRLQELNAPEVIQRNEKRMLQEAVDALIDNSARHGKTVTASTGQKRQLKSLADMLKGKQGRFRQNLLGKRVDYSGRSVIVVGPHLKLNQCGLPKKMALELFKSFVIAKLIERELVYNVRSANRFIESNREEVWDILEEVIAASFVLLNRAPTLHRLGIQAFQPILIEGKAIQIHPLVCPAFNADFDGDQMAVHVPLSKEARQEASEIMLSSKNLLKPATGEPIVTPSQDIVLGTYYMTTIDEPKDKRFLAFANSDEALFAYQSGRMVIQTPIKVKVGDKIIDTTAGRLMFNRILPEFLQYLNEVVDKRRLKALIAETLAEEGTARTVQLLDDVKDLAIEYITKSGMSWGMDDIMIPEKKKEIISAAEGKIDEIYGHYTTGLLTDDERRTKVIEVWTQAKIDITEQCQLVLPKDGPVFAMIDSGARGSWGQTTQMMGMKGLVINPSGETIELPVKASFKEGFDVLEYFISTHGARKGLTDTALRTANAGYLTRRLVDVAQDVVIVQEDCGTSNGITITSKESEEMNEDLVDRLWGRVLNDTLRNDKGDVLLNKNSLVSTEDVEKLHGETIEEAVVYSVLTCEMDRGVCQKCYGYDLGSNDVGKLGTAAGIIAAQSIGEPGTQLTMRTFHTGGVAGADITQGLPRVEELFEARPLKKSAIIVDIDGMVTDIVEDGKQRVIKIQHKADVNEKYTIKKSDVLEIKDGDKVKRGQLLFTSKKDGEVTARLAGTVKLEEKTLNLFGAEDQIMEYPIPAGYGTWVKKGEVVASGQQLTEGSLDLYQLFELKGLEAVQKYIIKEIQYIYSSQGQKLNDKHIEVIIRQMFSRSKVLDAKDTDLVVGDVVSRETLHAANRDAVGRKGKPAVVEPVLLGITKASLSVDSFLSAASFQETARILIDAAVTGKIDRLQGLKENVIIGKLIPVGTGFGVHDKTKKQAVAADSAGEDK
ncbi:MAG: DNA-directed RNA polymerase subunit beta' [Candidatus Kerfeldbacteria bacterium CG15_BIG_FIL_POST_REV_8_21_14_020_45_12]|uniref:DNA-directed RNA polymerase subunit beta' n=1 Tax=Candidatus Kerfeldbacteria bacterium CG15_BIG_FIL_POST_REV_8_21_14_020_45_12 TaxID=2014247 RepID=A0A2M7H366_9BACT|nr:MAG: DNA-directed RNA polymerase subunit beta' [Candidatus Kerfeldbacteria bacterium CG15_BIG_FIL_POST_REV_8_21_14_020_45_12]PJA93835.1 MAG: DNA-directed RNA polymerase subunit beta' [Candidatus Kerfeldbacteria bacterium CG_4_9_14_3_um_filter_45_8]